MRSRADSLGTTWLRWYKIKKIKAVRISLTGLPRSTMLYNRAISYVGDRQGLASGYST